MTATGNKKKSPALLFMAVFAAIIIVTLLVNYKSRLVQEVNAPEAGVKSLSAYGKNLVSVSRSNEVHCWDWNDLSRKPQVAVPKAQKIALKGGSAAPKKEKPAKEEPSQENVDSEDF